MGQEREDHTNAGFEAAGVQADDPKAQQEEPLSHTHRPKEELYAALGDVKVEHLNTLKNAFQQLEAEWSMLRHKKGTKPARKHARALRSRGASSRPARKAAAGAWPPPPQHSKSSGEQPSMGGTGAAGGAGSPRPVSPNSVSLQAHQAQQGEQQQQRPRERSARSRPAGPPSARAHAEGKRKAPGGDGPGAGGCGQQQQAGGKVGGPVRTTSPTPKKKKQRPPWQDISIPGKPAPFTSDIGSPADQDHSGGAAEGQRCDGAADAAQPDHKQQGVGGKAAPPSKDAPTSASQPSAAASPPHHIQQPPSPSRIPRHPGPHEAFHNHSSSSDSKSRIPHFTPSPDPKEGVLQEGGARGAVAPQPQQQRQRKQWGTAQPQQQQQQVIDVGPLPAAQSPPPPQLHREKGATTPTKPGAHTNTKTNPPPIGSNTPAPAPAPTPSREPSTASTTSQEAQQNTLPPSNNNNSIAAAARGGAATPTPATPPGPKASAFTNHATTATPTNQANQPTPAAISASPPLSALRASAVESLKEGRQRALAHRASVLGGARAHAALAQHRRRSQSLEELLLPTSNGIGMNGNAAAPHSLGDEASQGLALTKTNSFSRSSFPSSTSIGSTSAASTRLLPPLPGSPNHTLPKQPPQAAAAASNSNSNSTNPLADLPGAFTRPPPHARQKRSTSQPNITLRLPDATADPSSANAPTPRAFAPPPSTERSGLSADSVTVGGPSQQQGGVYGGAAVGAAAALGSAVSALGSAQQAVGSGERGTRKEGFMRKLSALKRTVAPAGVGNNPTHGAMPNSVSTPLLHAKKHSALPPVLEPLLHAKKHSALPPVLEPTIEEARSPHAHSGCAAPNLAAGPVFLQPLAPTAHAAHAAAAGSDDLQQQELPRPNSEPAPGMGPEDRRAGSEAGLRRISDQGSPSRVRIAQAPPSVMDAVARPGSRSGSRGVVGFEGSRQGAAFGLDGVTPNAAPSTSGDNLGAAAGGPGKPGRARWHVAPPEPRQAAWRWEQQAPVSSSLARSSSAPFPEDAVHAATHASSPPRSQPNAIPVPPPSSRQQAARSNAAAAAAASSMDAHASDLNGGALPISKCPGRPAAPAARPSSPSPHSSLQRPPTTHQEISAAAASAAAAGFSPAPVCAGAGPLYSSPRQNHIPPAPLAAAAAAAAVPPPPTSRRPPHPAIPPASLAQMAPHIHTPYTHPLTPPSTAWLPPHPPYPPHTAPLDGRVSAPTPNNPGGPPSSSPWTPPYPPPASLSYPAHSSSHPSSTSAPIPFPDPNTSPFYPGPHHPHTHHQPPPHTHLPPHLAPRSVSSNYPYPFPYPPYHNNSAPLPFAVSHMNSNNGASFATTTAAGPTPQPSGALSSSSSSGSPLSTPPWMTLRDANAAGGAAGVGPERRLSHGGLDSAVAALQQQQQAQAAYGGKRAYANGHAEPSRIMDIMRMSASKFTAGWETALPHEAAMGPLSRFADVWSQRAQQQQQQQPLSHNQQPPQSPIAAASQQQQQQGGRGTPPPGEKPMDKRTLKLQHAFQGMSLGEVLAGSVRKTPPPPPKPRKSTSDGGAAKAVNGVVAGSPKK